MAENWLSIETEMGAEDMRMLGPSLKIRIRAIGSDRAPIVALAQIDTGGGGSAISPRLNERLAAIPIDYVRMHPANQDPITVPVIRAAMQFPIGPEIQFDFGVFTSLGDPHDVLIGLDFLEFCRLNADFVDGKFTLQMGLHLFAGV